MFEQPLVSLQIYQNCVLLSKCATNPQATFGADAVNGYEANLEKAQPSFVSQRHWQSPSWIPKLRFKIAYACGSLGCSLGVRDFDPWPYCRNYGVIYHLLQGAFEGRLGEHPFWRINRLPFLDPWRMVRPPSKYLKFGLEPFQTGFLVPLLKSPMFALSKMRMVEADGLQAYFWFHPLWPLLCRQSGFTAGFCSTCRSGVCELGLPLGPWFFWEV